MAEINSKDSEIPFDPSVCSFKQSHIIFVSVFMFCVFTYIMWKIANFNNTDIYCHGLYLQKCIQQSTIPDAPLFYLMVAIATLFSSNLNTILIGMSFVLGASVALRFMVGFRTMEGWPKVILTRNRFAIITIVALTGVIFCFPGFEKYWFCSQFAPNLWHNSTYLVMLPFSILLFNSALDFIYSNGKNNIIKLTFLSLINVLIKPSFFFCFAPVFSLILLFKLRVSRLHAKGFIPLFFATIALGIYYWYVFIYTSTKESSDHGVGFGFLTIWSHYCQNIPLSFLNSMLIPILFGIIYPRVFLKDYAIRVALMLVAVGVAIYAFVEETGARNLDGNFWWQLPACNYIFHLACISAFFREKELRSDWKVGDWILFLAFLLQVVSGIAYIWKVATTGDYY